MNSLIATAFRSRFTLWEDDSIEFFLNKQKEIDSLYSIVEEKKMVYQRRNTSWNKKDTSLADTYTIPNLTSSRLLIPQKKFLEKNLRER